MSFYNRIMAYMSKRCKRMGNSLSDLGLVHYVPRLSVWKLSIGNIRSLRCHGLLYIYLQNLLPSQERLLKVLWNFSCFNLNPLFDIEWKYKTVLACMGFIGIFPFHMNHNIKQNRARLLAEKHSTSEVGHMIIWF